MNNLGFILLGDGDLEAAALLLEAAVQGGSVDAHYNLGRMLEVGRGVMRDTERAARLYEAAAKQGHGKALNRLGCLLYRCHRHAPLSCASSTSAAAFVRFSVSAGGLMLVGSSRAGRGLVGVFIWCCFLGVCAFAQPPPLLLLLWSSTIASATLRGALPAE